MEGQGGHARAVEGDLDPARPASMTAEIPGCRLLQAVARDA